MSQISEAERKIDGASPVVYRPVGLIIHPDTREKILNIRSIMPVRPAAPVVAPNCSWGEAHHAGGFPFIHRILSQMFIDATPDSETPDWLAKYAPDIQLNTLLAWL